MVSRVDFVWGIVTDRNERGGRPSSWERQRAFRLPSKKYEEDRPVHVVIATYRRRPRFRSRGLAALVFDRLVAAIDPWAACLLPDHLHLLLGSSRTMVRDLGEFKSLSTRSAWEEGHHGRLWQRSYWDRLIRSSEGVYGIANYIVWNAVYHGLVEHPADYPWWTLRDPGLLADQDLGPGWRGRR